MTVNRINVLWLIKGLGSGGAENLLVSAARHLNRDRFNYSAAYFLPWKNQLVDDLEATGMPVACLNQRMSLDPRPLISLTRKLRRDHTDILHAHLPYSGIVGRLASKLTPVKSVVYSEHNVWERYHRITHFANKMTFRWNDAVIAVSENVEQSIRAGTNINGRMNLGTIANGVDVDQLNLISKDPGWLKAELGIPAENKIVVNVANFTPKKRHIDLLKAARKTVAEQPATSFVLVGQGPILDETRAAAAEMGLEGNVYFTGLREDAREIIAAADLFVLSSQFEGMPISVLEAMGTRTPVLSTRVGGLPEMIVAGEEGMLVEPGNPEILADSIVSLLGDEPLRRSLADRAFARVRDEFDVRNMVRKIEQLYLDLAEEKLAGGRSS